MCKTNKPRYKKGILYNECKKYIRPFDVIFFKGDALLSAVISILEEHGNKIPGSGEFSHVAIVINSDVYVNENVLPGRLYIIESIVGGPFANGVKDIDGNITCGVQIRDLEEVIDAFDKSNDTIVAWGKILHNPIEHVNMEDIKIRMNEFCHTYVGKKYDANPYSLLSAVFPCMRGCRKNVEKLCHTEDWYFCSEIVAVVFKYFGIYPPNVIEKDVLPRDILHPEADIDKMPKVVDTLTYITIPIHQQIKNMCHKK